MILKSTGEYEGSLYVTDSHQLVRSERIKAMFDHAFRGYLEAASDYDELKPISCRGTDTWGR